MFEKGYEKLKQRGIKEERRILLMSWLEFEQNAEVSVPSIIADLESRIPLQVKKRRRLYPEDPEDLTMEEYFDYVFLDDEEEQRAKAGVSGVSKLLAIARQWKQSAAQ